MAGLPAGLPIANCRRTPGGPGGGIIDVPDTYLLAGDTVATGRLLGGVYSAIMGMSADSVSDDDPTYASISPHFAGRIALVNAGPEINIGNLTIGNTYDFYIALVNYGNPTPQASAYQAYSGFGSSGTEYRSQSDVALPEGGIMDALGNTFTDPAAYMSGCSKLTFSAVSTLLNIRRGLSGAGAQVAMIGIKDVTGGAANFDLTTLFVG